MVCAKHKNTIYGIISAAALLVVVGCSDAIMNDENGLIEKSNIYFAKKNELLLELPDSTDEDKKTISVFHHTSHTYFSLSNILNILKFEHEIDYQNYQASIKIDGHDYTLFARNMEYLYLGKSGEIYGDSVFIYDREIYVDSSFIQAILSYIMNVDIANNKLTYSKSNSAFSLLSISNISYDKIKDDLSCSMLGLNCENGNPSETPKDNSLSNEDCNSSAYNPITRNPHDLLGAFIDSLLKLESCEKPALDAETIIEDEYEGTSIAAEVPLVQVNNITEDGAFLFQPRINKIGLMDIFFEVIIVDNKEFLPLIDIADLLEFNFNLSEEGKQVSGWFLKSKNKFDLNLDDNKAYVIDNSFEIIDGIDYVTDDNDILYISSENIAKWFDIELATDFRLMEIKVSPNYLLPMQIREERKSKWERIMYLRDANTKTNFPVKSNEYKKLSWPFIDVDINQNYQSTSDSKLETQYSIISRGDLGRLTTELFMSGLLNDKPFDRIRLKAGRTDIKGKQLGFLQATEFSFGDIISEALPLVTKSGSGRGFKVTNRTLDYVAEFDKKTFIGDATPGWEAEIYRNGILLEFQDVGSDGRYSFEDIAVLFGRNIFRIVLYGPQGQVEEKLETVFAGDNSLKKGDFQYIFSGDEKGKSLIDVYNNDSSVASEIKSHIAIKYGLFENFTIGSGFAHTPVNGREHNYLTTSFASSLMKSIFANANFAYDLEDNSWATRLAALTTIGDFSISTEYSFYDNFISEEEGSISDPHETNTSININGLINLPFLRAINLGLGGRYETFATQGDKKSANLRLSKNVFGVGVTNNLTVTNNGGAEGWDGSGVFALQGRFGKILSRTTAIYDIIKNTALKSLNTVAQYRVSDRLLSRTQLTHFLDDNNQSSVRQSFNWEFDNFNLGFLSEVNKNKDVFAGFNISFSLAKDPINNIWHMKNKSMSNSGAVVGRAFVDENYDGILNDNEQIIEDSAILVNRKKYKSDNGVMFAPNIESYQSADVTLDLSTIKDPLMVSSQDGYSINTRPGDTVFVDFPVISTSEVDGTLYFENLDNEQSIIAYTPVELINSEGKSIKHVMSEIDGFFLFDKIKPGEYIITVPQEVLNEYNATYDQIKINILQESDIYSEQDIIIKAKEQTTNYVQ